MSELIDITSYSDDELILIVDNDEFLYTIRYEDYFPFYIDNRYKYNPIQYCNLVKHLQNDK